MQTRNGKNMRYAAVTDIFEQLLVHFRRFARQQRVTHRRRVFVHRGKQRRFQFCSDLFKRVRVASRKAQISAFFRLVTNVFAPIIRAVCDRAVVFRFEPRRVRGNLRAESDQIALFQPIRDFRKRRIVIRIHEHYQFSARTLPVERKIVEYEKSADRIIAAFCDLCENFFFSRIKFAAVIFAVYEKFARAEREKQ